MKTKLLFACMLATFTLSANAQENTETKKFILETPQQTETVNTLLKMVKERYIFEDVAKKIDSYISQKLQKNAYQDLKDPAEFANALTRDLQFVSGDKHLRLRYSAEVLPKQQETEIMEIPPSEKENFGKMLRYENYGIRKLEVLKGNIGYLDIAFFCAPEFAGDTYAAALNYLAHTDQLIIDLRKCGGSTSPDAIPFICSYFFETPVHLNDLQWRKGNKVTQAWTYAYVPGKKYLNKPIYILTSNGTFSGAEELAYDLQNLKRATIIGQITGGGANPGADLRVNDHFAAFIPLGRAVNPITKTNWEGVGVKPDTLINSRLALTKAQEMAMENTLKTTKDQQWQNAVSGWLTELKNNKTVLKPLAFELKGFPKAAEVYVVGSFNDWSATSTKMKKQGNKWIAQTEAEPGKVTYKFIVDGNWILDPDNPTTETDGGNTNSVISLK